MDSDQGKLFIGGVSWETTEEKLKEYFENYGEVVLTVVMREKFTGRPRGFGFVVFADPSVLDRVLQDTHTIDGRTVRKKSESLLFGVGIWVEWCFPVDRCRYIFLDFFFYFWLKLLKVCAFRCFSCVGLCRTRVSLSFFHYY